ncbi:MAG TPA: FG-GAP-like repeat-containing protein, partial [Puia sp.]|nr:FG-GAP-like repeat-containing protein [Puia sp.]
ISNGIPKRLNDIDYINFVTNHDLQQKMRDNNLSDRDMELIDRFPKIKLPSKFFQNTGTLQFRDIGDEIDGARPTYSNGAAYADLDGDGDMDIIVNNIDDYAMLYRNTSNDTHNKPYVDISLKGPEKNINALGAKLILFTGKEIRTYEKYPVHGFMSSMEIPIHIGLDHTQVDSAFLIWPDNTFQRVDLPKGQTPQSGEPGQSSKSGQSGQPSQPGQSIQSGQPGQPAQSRLQFTYTKGLPLFDYTVLTTHWKNPSRPMEDVTAASGIAYRHEENNFHEFDREPLLPHMLSTEGPALAVGDINHDGLEDFFIGSSKWKKSAIFLQQRSGTFIRSPQPALEADSTYEDVAACWADLDHDGNPDLVVAAGGNEYFGNDTLLTPRVYLGDGKGHFAKSPHAIENVFVNASSVTAADFNGDGAVDLFVGGRSVPWEYGTVPHSYLLLNDGKGRFKDVTDQLAPGLSRIGFVTSAQWFDLDKNGQQDLLLTLEWGGIIAFMNDHGHLTKKVLTDKNGWWNFVLPVDLNGDGNIDLVAGNLGLNSRLKASDTEPVKFYYYDFDNNGKKDQVLTYWLNGRELPFANKEELEKEMPSLRKNFLYAEKFAKASLQDLFSREKLAKADTFRADYFSNAIFINTGDLHFRAQAMPWDAQLSPFRDAVVVDANNDSLPDILLVGNYYDNNIQMGRYDADYGTLLLNQGNDSFAATTLNGLAIKGQVRHIQKIRIGGKDSYILAKNNDSARLIRFSAPPPTPPFHNPRR